MNSRRSPSAPLTSAQQEELVIKLRLGVITFVERKDMPVVRPTRSVAERMGQ